MCERETEFGARARVCDLSRRLVAQAKCFCVYIRKRGWSHAFVVEGPTQGLRIGGCFGQWHADLPVYDWRIRRILAHLFVIVLVVDVIPNPDELLQSICTIGSVTV